MDREPGKPVVAVCIATLRRPEGLTRLLEGIHALICERFQPEVRIIVVDNDPAGSAEPVCDRLRATLRWPLHYCVEPRPGIAPARNRALASVEPDVDFVASADVVGGPVLPHFPQPTAPWILQGPFFHKKRYATGERLPLADGNNALVRVDILGKMGTIFDERYGLIGCADEEFFQRVARAGFKIVWADEAIVREWIPPERTHVRWLMQRMFRVGNAMTLVELDHKPGFITRCRATGLAAAWLGIGLWEMLWGLVDGRRSLVNGLRHIAFCTGRLCGLAGMRYEEYRNKGNPPFFAEK
jgi:hypothetical protein